MKGVFKLKKRRFLLKTISLLTAFILITAGLPVFSASADDSGVEVNFIFTPIKNKTELQLTGFYYYQSQGSEFNIDIPESYNYSNLGELPVTEIASDTFSNYNEINTISIPKTIKKIGSRAFMGSQVKSYSVAGDNPYYKSVNGVLFSKDGKTLLSYPILSENDSYAVPEGTEIIAPYAFYAKNSRDYLYALTLPSTLKSIGAFSFYGLYNLNFIELPEGVISVGDGAFAGGGINSAFVPASLTDIGDDIFKDASVIVYAPQGSKISEYYDTVVMDAIENISLSYDTDSAKITEGTSCDIDENGRKNYYYNGDYRIVFKFKNSSYAVAYGRNEFESKFGYYPSLSSDQSSDNQWEPGNHEFFIYVFGRRLAIPITIIESRVSSYELAPITILENTYFEGSGYNYRDLVRFAVTFKDGSVELVTPEALANLIGVEYYGNFGLDDDQYSVSTPWKAGTEHSYTLSMNGIKPMEGTVKITENPYISAEVLSVPKSELLPGEKFRINGTEIVLHTSSDTSADEPLVLTMGDYYRYGELKNDMGADKGFYFGYSVDSENKLTVSWNGLSAEYQLSVKDVSITDVLMLKKPLDGYGTSSSFKVVYSDNSERIFSLNNGLTVTSYISSLDGTNGVEGTFETPYGMYTLTVEYKKTTSYYTEFSIEFCGRKFYITGSDLDLINTNENIEEFCRIMELLYIDGYNGVVDESNIKFIAGWLHSRELVDAEFSQNEDNCDILIFDAENLKTAIKKYLVTNNFDIETFSGYDSGKFISDETLQRGKMFDPIYCLPSLNDANSGNFEYVYNVEGAEKVCNVTFVEGKISAVSNFFDVGDTNGDGFIDIRDLVRIKKTLAGTGNISCSIFAADINKDRQFDANDLVAYIKMMFEIL